MTHGLRVRVGSDYVAAVRHVKNIGVYLDSHLDMTTQVSRTISTCSFHMRNIAQMLRYLTRPTTERVVNALITSRLDYCNSLLFGTSASNINRLQRLQNSVARLVTRQARRDSAMPILRELHLLPVRHRVSYKMAELTFKALHVDLSPTYLQQCVQVYTPARSLRSVNSYTLVQNRSRTVGTALSCLKNSPLCIGLHVTTLYLYVMNNAIIIMFLKMCYYYYSLYIIYIFLNNVIYLFNAINFIYLALV